MITPAGYNESTQCLRSHCSHSAGLPVAGAGRGAYVAAAKVHVLVVDLHPACIVLGQVTRVRAYLRLNLGTMA